VSVVPWHPFIQRGGGGKGTLTMGRYCRFRVAEGGKLQLLEVFWRKLAKTMKTKAPTMKAKLKTMKFLRSTMKMDFPTMKDNDSTMKARGATMKAI
jgi:hypothetical protein